MDLLGLCRGGRSAGPDGPDGFVGDDALFQLPGFGQPRDSGLELVGDNIHRFVAIALFEFFSNTENRGDGRGDSRLYLGPDLSICFIEDMPPLGVSQEDTARSAGENHIG